MNQENINTNNNNKPKTFLEKFCINLNERALKWKQDPIIWRDEEVRRVIQILSRRSKNNPVLTWEAWVWKTAVVEWLAQRIISWEVPDSLKTKTIYSLDMWLLIAWAKFQWEFEERLKWVIDEVSKKEWEIILFIDEIHTIVWTWAWWDSGMDAWNLLKPALARWELHCIWATTINEYRKYIEKDPALERRFQPVNVEEPTVEDAIAILRWIKEKYEIHHWVKISDKAIIASVVLSDRYLVDRQLPDKAIDLMDEATSALKMELESEPIEIDKLKREIVKLEVEKFSISSWDKKDPKILEINEKLEKIKEEKNKLETQWKKEKSFVDKIRKIKEELDQKNIEKEKFQREWNFEKLAEIQYSQIPKLEEDLAKAEREMKTKDWGKTWNMLREEVTEDDIAKVLEKWTWIPASKLKWSDQEKLVHLEEEIWKRVIWQKAWISAIANAVRRSRTWLNEENKPLASFLFLWPTWVWKTEISKALSEVLFNDEDAMIRFDMSEYMESHSVSKLIWSPPWYIWHDEWWRLTESLRRKPYSVLLFDEVEKAHPEVFNVFLQLLDDWRITDSKWRTVSAKNAIIIMTSNIWSQDILEATEEWKTLDKQKIFSELQKFFRPEFLNRIDEIVIFEWLTKEDLIKIVDIQLKKISWRMEKNWKKIKFSDEVKNFIVEKSYDPKFWARPLKRFLQKEIMDKIAIEILENSEKVEFEVWEKNWKIFVK